MKAMQLQHLAQLEQDPHPLKLVNLPVPIPGENEILLRVSACAVCHTELDEIEGRLPPPRLPVIPGHQVVGHVAGKGRNVRACKEGERLGVAWIFSACGICHPCQSGCENLCADFRGTGRDVDGGYAEYMIARQEFTFSIPGTFTDVEAAPLLCAGAIGYRALQLANLQDGQPLGLTGFGSSGHLVLKLARHTHPNSPMLVFARSEKERSFARQLGAAWTGDTLDQPPYELNAIIDTTPAWRPVVEALKHLSSGGRLVVNAIRKEAGDRQALLDLDYPTHLWMEKEIKSVANVTRTDVRAFLELAAEIPIRPAYETLPLENANRALVELKRGDIQGARILVLDQ